MLLGIKDIIDILLVAFILFTIYRILRRSGASNLFWGILAFIMTWLLVSYVFHLELTSALFDRFVSVGAIALIVISKRKYVAFSIALVLGLIWNDSKIAGRRLNINRTHKIK